MAEPETAEPLPAGGDPLDAGLAAGFGDPDPTDARTPPSERDLEPRRRAPYRLLGEIARGGMGVILKGHDSNLGRDVALKVLREDLARRPEVMRRFVEEARIGGQLEHPGIVPVYELGLMADERPYFAMKLIEGRTLSAMLAGRARGERRDLLDVFEAVCQALAYAHARGVVHRDLKPGNVLIGAFGEVQVVDWGLAKVLRSKAAVGDVSAAGEAGTLFAGATADPALETVHAVTSPGGAPSVAGSVMGTPAYMSPEQARGETATLDERSDVFSLGAILCEILTGEPPFASESERTLEQAAGAQLGDAMRRLDACGADRELVELCKQCLSPAPEARPRSAAVLAERVHAYLASVEERARTAEVRAGQAKVRARATALVSAAGLALIVLAGGGWLWMQRRDARRLADTERAVTAALQGATLAQGKQDWSAAGAMLERARARLEGVEGSDPLRARVAELGATIDREARDARRASQLLADNDALTAELQDVRLPEGSSLYPTDWTGLDRRYGEILAAHGLALDETDAERSARALAERGISVDLASAIDEWSSVRRSAQDEPGAERLTAVADALDPDPARRELRAALAADDLDKLRAIAAQRSTANEPAPTLRLLAHALVKGQRLDEALAILNGARRRFPQDFEIAIEIGRALRATAPVRASEAVAHFEAALALRPANVEVWHELGQTLHNDLRRAADALVVFRSAVERTPSDGHLHFHVGTSLLALERFDEAVTSLRRSIELQPDYAVAHCNLGISLRKLGRLPEAMECTRRAIELDPTLWEAHFSLGVELETVGRFEEAVASHRRAVELRPDLAEAHYRLGYALGRLDRNDDAIECYRRALELKPPYLATYLYLGEALERTGRADEAIEAYGQAIRVNPKDATAHRDLAWLIETSTRDEPERGAEALEHARRAVELAPERANSWKVLGIASYLTGDFSGARNALLRAAKLGPADAAGALFLLLASARLGDREETAHWLEHVEPWFDELEQLRPGFRAFVAEARTLLPDKK